jgi:antitoxin VapB
MGLNIKNEQTHRMVQELADLMGASMSAAVEEAVREKLEKMRKERSRERRIERLKAIATDCAARLNGPGPKMMEIEDLYDEETGLPK